MKKENDLILAFNEIAGLAFGETKMKPENEAQNIASIITYGLDALNEFGGVSDFRTAYLMSCIRSKFDPTTTIGKEIYEFIDNVNTIIIQSNRYVWDYGKISNAITQKIQ